MRPDRLALKKMLNDIPPSDMLLMENQTRELFARAVEMLKTGPETTAASHALDVRLPIAIWGIILNSTVDTERVPLLRFV